MRRCADDRRAQNQRGGRISPANPATGQRTNAGQVPDVIESGESGLNGRTLGTPEVSVIVAGRNYGWPTVYGFCDDDIGSERPFCQSNNVIEPLAAWTPAIAPAGADVYVADLIPQWKGSLLFTSLEGAALYRLTLSATGDRVTSREALFQGRFGRLRDVLVGPDAAVYLATSNRDGRGSPSADDDRVIRIRP